MSTSTQQDLDYLAWADEQGLDPDEPATRASWQELLDEDAHQAMMRFLRAEKARTA